MVHKMLSASMTTRKAENGSNRGLHATPWTLAVNEYNEDNFIGALIHFKDDHISQNAKVLKYFDDFIYNTID
jgi:hypothetical protein